MRKDLLSINNIVRLLIAVFVISLFFSFPRIYVKPVVAVYDCSLSLSGAGIEWVDKSTNTFYYNSANDAKNITFHFDTSRVPWHTISPNYNTAKLAIIINRGLSGVDKLTEGQGLTKAGDLSSVDFIDSGGKVVIDDNNTAYSVQLVGNDNNELICEGTYKVVPKLGCRIDSITPIPPSGDLDSRWIITVSNITVETSQISPGHIYFETSEGRRPVGSVPYSLDTRTVTWDLTNNAAGPPLLFTQTGPHTVSVYAVGARQYDSPFSALCSGTFEVYPRDPPICSQSPCRIGIPPRASYNCTLDECKDCSWCRLHPTSTPTPTPRPTDSPECGTATCRGPNPGVFFCSKSECQSCLFCQPIIPPPGSPSPIPPVPSLAPICEQIDPKYETNCKDCVEIDHGIWTAIGCVPTDLELILKNYVFVYGVGIAGGIAFLYFIYGVFLILTSAGNAEKIAEGKEIIISALSGLFLIIFSVFLLRVIGYDILKIPGFG